MAIRHKAARNRLALLVQRSELRLGNASERGITAPDAGVCSKCELRNADHRLIYQDSIARIGTDGRECRNNEVA